MNLFELIKKYCLKQIQDEKIKNWLDQKLNMIKSDQEFFISFALVNKKIPRDHLQPTLEQIKNFHRVNSEFTIENWRLDQLCRLSLLMNYPLLNLRNLTKLISVADTQEQITIYKSIFYLENASQYTPLVVDGIRTNIIDIFDAIALKNLYPTKYFSEDQWNQMVLKAIFMERPIYQIKDIDLRRNEKLAHILFDYARERWAASRLVTPELWRMIRGYLTKDQFLEMKKQMGESIKPHQESMLKLIQESKLYNTQQWLNVHSVELENISWDKIGSDFFYKNQASKKSSKTKK